MSQSVKKSVYLVYVRLTVPFYLLAVLFLIWSPNVVNCFYREDGQIFQQVIWWGCGIYVPGCNPALAGHDTE